MLRSIEPTELIKSVADAFVKNVNGKPTNVKLFGNWLSTVGKEPSKIVKSKLNLGKS